MNASAVTKRDNMNKATKGIETALVDVFENNEEYLVVADVPGAKKDGLAIAYRESELRLSATVHGLNGDFEFRRVLTIGADIDATKIAAELERGVLKVHLPKSEMAKPRQIPITVV